MLSHSCLHISSRQLLHTATKALRSSGQLRFVLPSARAMLTPTLQGHTISSKQVCCTSRAGSTDFHSHSSGQGKAPHAPAQLRCQHSEVVCSRRHLHARAALASSASPTSLQPPAGRPFLQPAMPGQAVPNTAYNSAIEGRHSLLRQIPLEIFRIAGVSFEGRQEQVAKLQQGVSCQPESDL